MNADIDELVSQVRKELDEVTLAGQRVQTDTDLADTASSNFSDESLKDRLMDGTRYVVARVRSQYLEDFIIQVTPSDFEPPYDGSTPQIFRLLGSRVTADDSAGEAVECTRRTFSEHLKMENQRGLVASETYPVFVYQDVELLIENQTTNDKRTFAVRVPTQRYSDVTDLPNTFRGAVVQYAAFTCFQTLREQEEVENSKAILQRELASYRLPFRQGPPEEESE